MNNSISSSLAFKAAELVFSKGMGFIIGIILARLLAPETFGVVAIITAIIALLEVFVTSGLETALVQNKDTSITDYSTVFYISFFIAVILYAALYAAAPFLTVSLDISEYVIHLRILTSVILFYSLSSIQTAKLTREMQFNKMMVCNIITMLISGTLGIYLAYADYGIWALVAYYWSHALVLCVAYSFAAMWLPELKFSITRGKELFVYGYKLLLSSLLCSFSSNLQTFVIGKLYSKTNLGIYSRGNQIPSIVSKTIDGAFNSVMLPVLSKEQNNITKVRSLLSKTISVNSFINFPLMLGLATIAPIAVLILYTDKWAGAIPYVQLFSLSYLTFSITSPCLIAIKAMGRSDIYLKLETVRRFVSITILLTSLSFHSLMAIAVGMVVTSIIDAIIVMLPVRKHIGYTYIDLLKDTIPTILISAVMCLCICLFEPIPVTILAKLIIEITTGIILYLLLNVIFKVKSFSYLKNLSQDLKN